MRAARLKADSVVEREEGPDRLTVTTETVQSKVAGEAFSWLSVGIRPRTSLDCTTFDRKDLPSNTDKKRTRGSASKFGQLTAHCTGFLSPEIISRRVVTYMSDKQWRGARLDDPPRRSP